MDTAGILRQRQPWPMVTEGRARFQSASGLEVCYSVSAAAGCAMQGFVEVVRPCMEDGSNRKRAHFLPGNNNRNLRWRVLWPLSFSASTTIVPSGEGRTWARNRPSGATGVS